MPEFYTSQIQPPTSFNYHPEATGRGLPDQHPIGAITGLTEKIANDIEEHNQNENAHQHIQDKITQDIETHDNDTEAHGNIDNRMEAFGTHNTGTIIEDKTEFEDDTEFSLSAFFMSVIEKINGVFSKIIDDIVVHNENENAHPYILNKIDTDITDNINTHNTDTQAHGNIDNKIAQAQLANQKWLPAVASKSDLPTVPNVDQTYLCRVIDDTTPANIGVYQWISGGAEWTYFSDNLDFVNDIELDEFTTHNTGATIIENTDKFNVDTSFSLSQFFHAVVSKLNGMITFGEQVALDLAEHIDDNDKHTTSGEHAKLSGIEAGAQVNVIEEIKLNGTPLSITDKSVDIEAGRNLVIDTTIATVSFNALANTTYRYGTLTSLTINSFQDDNRETIIQFRSGSTATILSLPSIQAITLIPVIIPNKWYEISVLNGILSMSQGG